MTITFQTVITTATNLLSEDNDNPEYDRAITEMTTRLLGLGDDAVPAFLTILRGFRELGERRLIHAGNPRKRDLPNYREQRRSENRAACTTCGTSDADCTERVLTRKGSCCASCANTDTHPKMGTMRGAGPHLPDEVFCLTCHAKVGEPCKTGNGGFAKKPHAARVRSFRRQLREARS